ncbi:MAG: GNAT family N-acetyltransferase [Rudaea sp.]
MTSEWRKRAQAAIQLPELMRAGSVMIDSNFSVEPVDWSNPRDRDACRAVREEVFVVEQRVPQTEEWDELDAVSQHVVARDLTGQAIGTGRLVPPQSDSPPRVGRMAVLKSWRGRHVGEAILHALVDRARTLGYPSLEMHAQSHALPFYARFGFAAYGEEFLECEIAHRHMRRELEQLRAPDRAITTRGVTIASREQAATEMLTLIQAAKCELRLYMRDLDLALLDNELALAALKGLALAGRGTGIRILVHDTQAGAQRWQRVLALARRLTSAIALRTPDAEDLGYTGAFCLNDTHGYLFRPSGDRYEGDAAAYAPGRHAQLQEYFDQVWQRAQPCEEARRLDL